MPIYQRARFIPSYDAGGGQRYYLLGVNTDFARIVAHYRAALVFEEPAIHMFEVGRFRDEAMAFPPGVTVRDRKARRPDRFEPEFILLGRCRAGFPERARPGRYESSVKVQSAAARFYP